MVVATKDLETLRDWAVQLMSGMGCALTRATIAEETITQLMKAQKKSQSNRKQITKGYSKRIDKDAAKKQRAVTKTTAIPSTKNTTTTTSNKSNATSKIDKGHSKRPHPADSDQDESDSSFSESESGAPAAAGSSHNSSSNAALGEPQNSSSVPTRKSTRVARTQRVFCMFDYPPECLSDKTPRQEDNEKDESD
ncbi:hypothetical protein FN846DRAFT_891199 [Sphaerosporella brunnea]|uniref:Uncharacterized protein n=1 Tax=Sphaerosporella brunnea TaxID=1250544 RepID=A0A5J5ETD6_9PEZI|nr:hypothetical protein FN846DRAFT_891199 [Sphaerosporella brunnea]